MIQCITLISNAVAIGAVVPGISAATYIILLCPLHKQITQYQSGFKLRRSRLRYNNKA